LNHGTKDRHVDEEHHFLENHFNRQTFYGVVRPYSSFHNEPFPPPPIPPSPFPKEIKKPATTGNKSGLFPEYRELSQKANFAVLLLFIICYF
jgi:hypothetical protein